MAGPVIALQPRPLEWQSLYKLVLLIALICLAILYLPNGIWDSAAQNLVVTLGCVAAWRYSWWLSHLVRAQVYGRFVFPKFRSAAETIWRRGWRPPMIHFVVVTFREQRDITERVLDSIVDECRTSAIPARIFIGTGDASDERVIENYFAGVSPDLLIEVVIIRQKQPGKRLALGAVLRAMSRRGVHRDDLAVFMDGDSVLGSDVVRKCAPLFRLNPNLGAVTTDEEAVVIGPRWMQSWCDLRFAQRRLAMQSHSLSRKVLTLTGRLSIFRACYVAEDDFIRTVENDCLSHWLWGNFRFLSGDDKSTWFWMLRNGHQMLFVPDASAFTIENIEGNGYERMKQNLLRWSGNMLRNGSRALALGPGKCGFFIWWCVLDQRLSIWTMLSGPVAAVCVAVAAGPAILLAYLVWVLATRVLVSMVLYGYARRIDPSFPFLLYANQLIGSIIKVFLLFRISRQRWVNRGDQRLRLAEGHLLRFQNGMAAYMTVGYVALFVFLISIATGALE